MKQLALLTTAVWLLTGLPVAAVAQDAAPSQAPAASPEKTPAAAPKCHAGPITKNFGNEPWLVYGCDDNRTVIIVAADNNPAKPFYFIFAPGAGKYHLHGEGAGDREATRAAFNELKALSKQDLQALIDETKSAGREKN